MNFSTMDYFVTLARTRNFTRAAEELHITQQSLSAHIAALEQELGCQLFLRRVPLELTYGGETFLRYAQSFRKDLGDLRRTFQDIRGDRRGRLRVGVAHTRGRAILPPILAAFQEDYPEVLVELAEDSNQGIQESLGKGELDLAIGRFPDPLPGVEREDFYEEEIVLLASRSLDGPALAGACQGNLSCLADLPFVLSAAGDIAGQIGRDLLARVGAEPKVKVTSNDVQTLLSLCCAGVGACFCPDNLARAVLSPEQRKGLVTIHLGEEARYPIRFAYPQGGVSWSILSAFLDTARKIWK